jgi:hypothetical protein
MKIRKDILLTVAGIAALIGVAALDDDTKNIVEIQQKAPALLGGNYRVVEVTESKTGGEVCYLVSGEVVCIESVDGVLRYAR